MSSSQHYKNIESFLSDYRRPFNNIFQLSIDLRFSLLKIPKQLRKIYVS